MTPGFDLVGNRWWKESHHLVLSDGETIKGCLNVVCVCVLKVSRGFESLLKAYVCMKEDQIDYQFQTLY